LAKFRQNHSKASRNNNFMLRAIIITAVLIGLMIIVFFKGASLLSSDNNNSQRSYPINTETEYNQESRTFLPDDNKSEVIHHKYYSLGYNEDLEIPNWVSYYLTEESLKIKNVKRAKRFISDDLIDSRSAVHSDYSHSGYTRGHMAPAGDMAFSQEAMQESFYMSNMTPQIKHFNGGVWRELEENVRDWAYDNDALYIVSGPIFYNDNYKKIGKKNKVAVPDAFYKAILDYEGRKKKSIGFIIPHEKTDKHLREFAVSIDQIEKTIGYDLFDTLIEDNELEAELEGTADVNRWQFDKKRFNQRVSNWNRQKN